MVGHEVNRQRNRALLAVLFFTGLRRSEAATLKWSDLDLDSRIFTAQHGKGDKSREVAIVGDFAVGAIRDWRDAQMAADDGVPRHYLFSHINKGGNMGADQPLWRMPSGGWSNTPGKPSASTSRRMTPDAPWQPMPCPTERLCRMCRHSSATLKPAPPYTMPRKLMPRSDGHA